jgi:toxin FitB
VTLSESRRERAGGIVRSWLGKHSDDRLSVSVLTLGEIERGIARLEVASRATLRRWADALPAEFAGRILPVDEVVAERWGRMFGELERSGRRPQLMDSLIAATALVHDLTVVTRNVRDFDRCGVTTENPWATA